MSLLLSSLLMLGIGAGCSGRGGGGGDDDEADGGGDAGGGDGGVVDDAGSAGDGGPELPADGSSIVAPAAEVVRQGGGGFLLRGVVLTPTGVLDPGEVLVVGDTIRCVAEDCSGESGAGAAVVIETHSVVSPGLIDSHNHLPYDFLPEWVPDPVRFFDNRYEWAEDPDYEAFVRPYTAHRSTGTHFCPAAKWGELRALVHGTTAVQGETYEQGCINRLVRNADSFHGLGHDHMQTTIGSVRDIDDEAAAGYVENFLDPAEPTTRLVVHMTEGLRGAYVEDEFASFAGRDPRANRHAGVSLLAAEDGSYRGTGVLIHSVLLTGAEIAEVAETDAKVVWSPSSNLALYGETADIAALLEAGITVGIGPDWTPSGEDDLLAEMSFAWTWARSEGVDAVGPEQLWRMATIDGAEAVGLSPQIGRLEAGARADVVVFGRIGGDPWRAVVESRAEDVRLVLIDGEGYFGDAALEPDTAVNGDCEPFDACGEQKYVCLKNTPGADSRAGESVDDVRAQLVAILEGTGYPPEEQYGRGDELLELVTCAD